MKPDIRKITRLVPRDGNLVQGQSELAINPKLAQAAAELIKASRNHYSPAEGVGELRDAVTKKIARFNNIQVDPKATPLELLITPGATGALIAIAHTHLKNSSALVFEPYYPYHRKILDELGGHSHVLPLHGPNLELDVDELRARCREWKNQSQFPLRAIIACSPANLSPRTPTTVNGWPLSSIALPMTAGSRANSDALLTKTVSGPKGAAAAAMSPARAGRSVRSACTAAARPPAARISATTASALARDLL